MTATADDDGVGQQWWSTMAARKIGQQYMMGKDKSGRRDGRDSRVAMMAAAAEDGGGGQ
jgi:hypothetical protein